MLLLLAVPAWGDAQGQAIRLFDRLAGVPISLDDPRLAQMVTLINRGDLRGAAAVATADAGFYNITLKHFATPMSNLEEDYQRPLNDFVATVIGAARDDLDARTLLSGNYVYQGDTASTPGTFKFNGNDLSYQSSIALLVRNTHYDQLERNKVDLKAHLVSVPQRGFVTTPNKTVKVLDPATNTEKDVDELIDPIVLPDTAGLLTTRQWVEEHLSDGTNRRPIQYAFQVFLCKKNTETRDSSVPETRVRRDVDRVPGGVASIYQTSCRGCHAPMDAMAGAYAYFDNDGGNYIRYTAAKVMGKMNKNSVFANGFRTTDDSWFNYYTQNQNAALGWAASSPSSGKGVNGVGAALANTRAFASCMAQKAFVETCRRDPRADEATVVQTLADKFVAGGYKLRGLFEEAAIQKNCLGN